MNNNASKIFLENVLFLSSLARFNTERGPLILDFYNCTMKNRKLRERTITLGDIQRFCAAKRMARKDQETAREEILANAIATLLGSVHTNWNLGYIIGRYNHVDPLFFKELGFHIASLALFENIIRKTIYAKTALFEISDKNYQFKNKQEYADLCFLVEPEFTFKNKWNACIMMSEKELLDAYVENWSYLDSNYRRISQIHWKIDSEQELIRLLLKEVRSILSYISLDLNNIDLGEASHSFLRPLIKLCSFNGNEVQYIVPFPPVLGATTHFRIENYIQASRGATKIEESSKGHIVELLTKHIFALLPNKNIVKNFRYRVGKKVYESDLILLFDKSLWIVEVKSHPIFKKIPLQTNRLLPAFLDKIEEGLEQGKRTLDHIKRDNTFLFNLGCASRFEELVKGIVVVFDGFIPTFLTQNAKFDKLLGTHQIYESIPEAIRFYVATALDLGFLNIQPDIERFEDFLIWRTSHRGKFPIVSYDETEYWAFFNDNYVKDSSKKEMFQKLIEKEMSLYYISARFNEKNYLAKMLANESPGIRNLHPNGNAQS